MITVGKIYRDNLPGVRPVAEFLFAVLDGLLGTFSAVISCANARTRRFHQQFFLLQKVVQLVVVINNTGLVEADLIILSVAVLHHQSQFLHQYVPVFRYNIRNAGMFQR